MHCGERIIGLSNPAWKFGKHLAMKGRQHRQDDHHQIEEDDNGLARGVSPIASGARQQRPGN
jgi:hypothetical protein